MKYSKENKESIKFLKTFIDHRRFNWSSAFYEERHEVTIDGYTYRRLCSSIQNVIRLLDNVREEGYMYQQANIEFRNNEKRVIKSRLHKDFGKQSFEDLCKQFENDDCDFEYYKRIYADDIDQLIKENYDHIPRID